MKASFEYLENHNNDSVLLRSFVLPAFDHSYHFHPELELTLIIKGKGKRYIGNHVADFKPGDLVLVGADLPHCWLSDPDSDGDSEAIVIQFKPDFCGEGFLQLKESEKIRHLFKLAAAGISLEGDLKESITERIVQLAGKTPFYKLHGLMNILQQISDSKKIQLLDDLFLHFNKTYSETLRFQKVYGYLIENYTRNVTLEEVASVASLSPSAFCRYFKKITGKTFTGVVIDFRIKHALNLLQLTEKSVSEIGLESGFSDLPYFTKTFKKNKKISPLEFRRMIDKTKKESREKEGLVLN